MPTVVWILLWVVVLAVVAFFVVRELRAKRRMGDYELARAETDAPVRRAGQHHHFPQSGGGISSQ